MPNRSAMPGRYHTGSMAILTTEMLPLCMHDLAVAGEPSRGQRVLHLMDVEPRLGDRDGGPNVETFGDFRTEGLRDQMAPGIERDNRRGPSTA